MKYFCPKSGDLTFSLRYLKVKQNKGTRISQWKKPDGELQYCESCRRTFTVKQCIAGFDGWQKNTVTLKKLRR